MMFICYQLLLSIIVAVLICHQPIIIDDDMLIIIAQSYYQVYSIYDIVSFFIQLLSYHNLIISYHIIAHFYHIMSFEPVAAMTLCLEELFRQMPSLRVAPTVRSPSPTWWGLVQLMIFGE